MTVDLCMAYNYMLMLVFMTLTLMQGHSGSVKKKNLLSIISTTKQAISIKFAITVGLFVLDLDFENVYRTGPSCLDLLYSAKIKDPKSACTIVKEM